MVKLEKTKSVFIVKGKKTTIGVRYINKKGTYKSRQQCNTCKHLGYILRGINGTYKESTCDRDGVTWRECSGSTSIKCKFQVQEGADKDENNASITKVNQT